MKVQQTKLNKNLKIS